MVKTFIFAVMAMTATASITDMSFRHFQIFGLIVAIPFAIYASNMVLSLAREEMSDS